MTDKEKELERQRRYREQNPEKNREQQRRYRAQNPEKNREQCRRYYEQNREKELERGRRYREQNREKRREANWRWREQNPEKARAADRRWREQNPEKWRNKNWRQRGNIPLRPQPAACDICGKVTSKLVSEHCHKTGVWRGWACHGCNRSLATLDRMRDDPAYAAKLHQYLRDAEDLHNLLS